MVLTCVSQQLRFTALFRHFNYRQKRKRLLREGEREREKGGGREGVEFVVVIYVCLCIEAIC